MGALKVQRRHTVEDREGDVVVAGLFYKVTKMTVFTRADNGKSYDADTVFFGNTYIQVHSTFV